MEASECWKPSCIWKNAQHTIWKSSGVQTRTMGKWLLAFGKVHVVSPLQATPLWKRRPPSFSTSIPNMGIAGNSTKFWLISGCKRRIWEQGAVGTSWWLLLWLGGLGSTTRMVLLLFDQIRQREVISTDNHNGKQLGETKPP